MFTKIFVEYCNESTIHGVRYLTDTRKTYLERCTWFLFLIFSIACCCWFTAHLYMSAQSSSIVMTISNRAKKISDLEFPSIVVCPTFPLDVHVFNATEELEKIQKKSYIVDKFSYDEMRALMDQYCGIFDMRPTPSAQFNYVQTLLKCNFRLNNMSSCRFGIGKTTCPHELQEIITNKGLCYSYNSLRSQSLYRSHNGATFDFSENLTQIIKESDEVENIAGPYERGRTSLLFLMGTEQFQESCKSRTDAFVVALRTRGDVFVINTADVRLKEDYETNLALTATVLEASEDLKSYRVEERECYFAQERALYFLRHYTQDNCHHECLTNLTLRHCGCVYYYMPRLKHTKVCFGLKANTCAEKQEQEYDNMGIGPCRCYPMCNSVSFNVNVATHKLNMSNFHRNPNTYKVYTHVSIFTKEKNVYPLQRSKLYGFNDYVANFGGVLGLFLGVSILSIIELFYYLFVRPLTLFFKRQQHVKVTEVKPITAGGADQVFSSAIPYGTDFGHAPSNENAFKRFK